MTQTDVLRVAVLVEAALIVVGLALFLGHGVWSVWAEPRTRRRLERGRAALQSLLDEDEPRPSAALTKLPRKLRTKLVIEIAPRLTGDARTRLTALAGSLGVFNLASKRCRSRLWWRRVQGARLFTLAGGGDDDVPALLDDARSEVRSEAARWAAEHPSDDVIEKLFAMLDDRGASTRFAVKDSLVRMGRPVADRLTRELTDRSGERAEPVLEVAVATPDPRFLAPAAALCHDDVPPVRALAAALLGALGGGSETDVLVVLLADPEPTVRAAAARALGRAGQWSAAPALAALLGDGSWEVRRQAALALRVLGAPGTVLLRRYVAADDPAVTGVAQQMLELPPSVVGTL